MASRKMLVHLDMTGNQLQNTGFEQLSTAPANPILAQQYWDTTNNKALIYDGTSWVELGSSTSITSNTDALTVTSNSGAFELTIADADTSNSGLLSSTFFDLLDGATSTNAFNSLVRRDGAGVFNTNTVDGLQPPTSDNQATNKAYVDTAVANAITSANNYTDSSNTSGMKFRGGLDCQSNPDYPAGELGDAYTVTSDGLIGGASGEQVRIGDFIICTATNAGGSQASVGDSWVIQERNMDLATDSMSGYVRLATATEVNEGTTTSAVPTIADVSSMVNAGTNPTYITKLTAGSTSYAVNHNLNGSVNCQLYNKVTGTYVSADFTRTSSNSITVNVNAALAQDHIFMATYIGVEPA
jgi:hypothetical protein